MRISLSPELLLSPPILAITISLFVAQVTVLTGCGGASQKEADFYYKLGASYMREGELQKAFVELQKAKDIDPGNKEVLNLLGLLYFQFEDYENAIKHFKKAISIDKRFSDARNNLGTVYASQKRWKEAIEEFNKAIENPLYQTPEIALTNLGFVYYRLKKYDNAIDAFQKAIKRNPNFLRAYLGLSLCYNKKAMYGEAASYMEEALKRDPLYGGDRFKAIKDMEERLLKAKGDDAEDLKDYLEILRY
jgi:type IV pilus assembly protein PilF